MEYAHFPWRPLGALLVEEGLLTAADLEQALAEQRRTGRLLGQVLVDRGYVSGTALVRALAAQHGVGLKPTSLAGAHLAGPDGAAGEDRAWRPLGRVLVEKGFVSEAELEQVLAEQVQRPERPLGEILVAGGYVSGAQLALALAEQHGVEVSGEDELEAFLEVPSPGLPTYHVYEVAYEPTFQRGEARYRGTSFLEAAEFACEYIQTEQPAALEIEKIEGGVRETVWTYSDARAGAEDANRDTLVRTFGFDPVKWDTGGQLGSGTKAP